VRPDSLEHFRRWTQFSWCQASSVDLTLRTIDHYKGRPETTQRHIRKISLKEVDLDLYPLPTYQPVYCNQNTPHVHHVLHSSHHEQNHIQHLKTELDVDESY
jgi:hypothetical protein